MYTIATSLRQYPRESESQTGRHRGGSGKHDLRQQRGCLHLWHWRLIDQQPGAGQFHRLLEQRWIQDPATRFTGSCCTMLRTTTLPGPGPRATSSPAMASPTSGRSPARSRRRHKRARARPKGEETGSSFQSWRASVPAAHGTPLGGYGSWPPGTSGPDPETPCSSPQVSAPPSRSDERHGADEDRAGDHPARGGSSDWRSLRKSSRALSSRNSLKSSCFASLIKPFSTAF
jgi:hypothetical protein